MFALILASLSPARLGLALAGLVSVLLLFVLGISRRLGIIGLVGLYPLLSGLERGIIPVVKLSEALAMVISGVIFFHFSDAWLRTWRPMDYAMLIYTAASALLGLVHLNGSIIGILYEERSVFQPVLMLLSYLAMRALLASREDINYAIRVYLYCATLAGGLALLQCLPIPPLREILIDLTGSSMSIGQGGSGIVRATGPFPIWHSLCGYLLPALFLGVAIALDRFDCTMTRRRLYACVAVIALAVFASLTIAAIISALLGSMIIALRAGQFARLLSVAIGFAVIASIVMWPALAYRYETQQYQRDSLNTGVVAPQTVSYRIYVWKRDYLPLLSESSVTGFGNTLPETAKFQHTENQYITLLLRGGVVLLLAGLGVILVLGMEARFGQTRRLLFSLEGSDISVLRASEVTALSAGLLWMVWPYLTNVGQGQTFAVMSAMVGATLDISRRLRFSASTSEKAFTDR